LREGVRERDIVVLSTRRDDESLASSTVVPGRQLVPLRSGKDQGIRYGSIHSFKGLEARAVVITDVSSVTGDRARDLFYVGVTRAQSRLVILAESGVRADLASLLTKVGR
jgi:superfamily I DNA/RNA helicase